jgi:hypothetical protein
LFTLLSQFYKVGFAPFLFKSKQITLYYQWLVRPKPEKEGRYLSVMSPKFFLKSVDQGPLDGV